MRGRTDKSRRADGHRTKGKEGEVVRCGALRSHKGLAMQTRLRAAAEMHVPVAAAAAGRWVCVHPGSGMRHKGDTNHTMGRTLCLVVVALLDLGWVACVGVCVCLRVCVS